MIKFITRLDILKVKKVVLLKLFIVILQESELIHIIIYVQKKY